jgi:rod shape-determining protein MreD
MGAGIFAFGQGLLIDIFSSGLLGLFALLYVIIFLGMKLGSSSFNLTSVRGQIFIISLAVLLKEILFVTFLHLFDLKISLSYPILLAIMSSALCSGLIAPFLFQFFNRFSRLFKGAYEEE